MAEAPPPGNTMTSERARDTDGCIWESERERERESTLRLLLLLLTWSSAVGWNLRPQSPITVFSRTLAPPIGGFWTSLVQQVYWRNKTVMRVKEGLPVTSPLTCGVHAAGGDEQGQTEMLWHSGTFDDVFSCVMNQMNMIRLVLRAALTLLDCEFFFMSIQSFLHIRRSAASLHSCLTRLFFYRRQTHIVQKNIRNSSYLSSVSWFMFLARHPSLVHYSHLVATGPAWPARNPSDCEQRCGRWWQAWWCSQCGR